MANNISDNDSDASEASVPPSFILEPKSEHRASMIILHGRGDNGPSFGKILLNEINIPTSASHDLPNGPSLPTTFPNTRFFFPTASSRPTARFKNWKLNQWFDFWSLFDTSLRPELQNEGLRENARMVEALIEEEAGKVGIENVIVGGISHGAAMAMITVLLMIQNGRLGAERRLGGLFGLCGWLPYAVEMNGVETRDVSVDVDDEAGKQEHGRKAIRLLHELLKDHESPLFPGAIEASAESSCLPLQKVLKLPVFLGHGTEDNTVPIERMEEAESVLASLGFEVSAKTYPDLGHWYSDDMLADLIRWAQN